MRRILLLMLIFVMLFGCKDASLEESYFENNEYIGFDDIDTNLSMEEYVALGYLIIEGIEIKVNEHLMDDFIKNAHSGQDGRLRIVIFGENETKTFKDLIRYKDKYYCFYMDEAESLSEPYEYILILEGKWGIPMQEYKMVVLSDRASLTFDQVNKAMVSSNTEYINSVGRHKIVLFKY